jgi:hypothetical protein
VLESGGSWKKKEEEEEKNKEKKKINYSFLYRTTLTNGVPDIIEDLRKYL